MGHTVRSESALPRWSAIFSVSLAMLIVLLFVFSSAGAAIASPFTAPNSVAIPSTAICTLSVGAPRGSTSPDDLSAGAGGRKRTPFVYPLRSPSVRERSKLRGGTETMHNRHLSHSLG
jgi:hypothetical protein